MSDISTPSFYPAFKARRSVGSRAHIALSQHDADATHAARRPMILKSVRPKPAPAVDFVNSIIAENQDIWDKMLCNTFCKQMAANTANIKNFNWYMVQDMLYLKNYVYWKLGFYGKADWDTVRTAPPSLTNDIGYVDFQIDTCTGDLCIPAKVVNSTVAVPAVQAYCDYLINATITEDWFSIHVMMLPCIVGYDAIASMYYKDPATDRTSIYWKLWIEPNQGGSSPGRYREFLNQYVAEYSSPVALKHWKDIFRKSCQMEIGFWEQTLLNEL